MNNILNLEQNFIDLSGAESPENMFSVLENLIQQSDLSHKSFKVLLGQISLSSEQIYYLKSIFDNSSINLEIIYTNSVNTQLAALNAGMAVSEHAPKFEQQLPLFETSEEEDNLEKALEEAIAKESQAQSAKVEEKAKTETLYIKQTLRSGQTLNFDGNIVIIGDCHPGSEIIASGDITVWGVLSGIAHAGSKGNTAGCIRALKINAIQLRIANLFSRRPDKLKVEKADKSNVFTPEEAKISHNEIIIYTLNHH